MSLSLHLFAIEKKVPEFILKLNKNNIIFSNKNYELSVQYRRIKKNPVPKHNTYTRRFCFSLYYSVLRVESCKFYVSHVSFFQHFFYHFFYTDFFLFIHFFDYFRYFISIFYIFCLLHVLSIHVNLLKKSELYKLPEPKKELIFFLYDQFSI